MSDSSTIRPGLRVVRDGGDGHVGTVIEIGGRNGSEQPRHTATVLWDSGVKANCRAGLQGEYDLLILDNATVGVQHSGVTCAECRQVGIWGFRWKCSTCSDCDLCNSCYVSGRHNVDHTFLRIESPSARRIPVPARSNSRTMKSKGIFAGAIVVRGHSWKYHNQDGGEGNKGVVLAVLAAPNGASSRSYVQVKWNKGSGTFDYRRGHDGAVDVKVATGCYGEIYFPTHLPKLDTDPPEIIDSSLQKVASLQPQVPDGGFVCGVSELNGYLFVITCQGNAVSVFGDDRRQFVPTKTIYVSGMEGQRDIASCRETGRLFVADVVEKCIWVLTDDGRVNRRLDTEHPLSVSVRFRRLLVTLDNQRRLVLFSPQYDLVRQITLPPYMRAEHAVESANETYLVCHTGWQSDKLHDQVTEINAVGNPLRSYGGQRGDGPRQLDWPRYLAVDPSDGSVFVADSRNNRIVMIDWKAMKDRVVVAAVDQPQRVNVLPNSGHLAVCPCDSNTVHIYERQ